MSDAAAGRVEPEWRMATRAFIDIHGFTTYADHAGAREAAEYLNEFFLVAIRSSWSMAGQVKQLLGDGRLAVFGAPGRLPDHADRALGRRRAACGDRGRYGRALPARNRTRRGPQAARYRR
jgi:adenylate cyclase